MGRFRCAQWGLSDWAGGSNLSTFVGTHDGRRKGGLWGREVRRACPARTQSQPRLAAEQVSGVREKRFDRNRELPHRGEPEPEHANCTRRGRALVDARLRLRSLVAE